MHPPMTRYARAGDIYVAYQVVGDSGPDLIFLPNLFSNIELFWELPRLERWFSRLARFSRLILFDQRGTGLSDPVSFERLVMLEERTEDIVAVLDAAGSERAILFSATSAVPLACYFAATNGERTSGLISLDGSAAAAGPELVEDEERIIQTMSETWGTPQYRADENETLPDADFFARYRRMSLAPGAAMAMFRAANQFDVTELLSAIHVPTLVLEHSEGVPEGWRQGKTIAKGIEAATLVELPGNSVSWAGPDQDRVLDEVETFVTGQRPAAMNESRVLATVLFTDVVSSTEHTARLGDRDWGHLLDRHDGIMRTSIDRFQGTFIDSAGDGVLARFDGPGRAIRCAVQMREQVSRIGIDIRAGLHTGEVELSGNDVRGLGVVVGARVSALAGAGEILVSSTVKDLVIGSGIQFEDRGEHQLKGVPDAWRVFAVIE